ncbi:MULTISPECIES: potassium transporter TrkA [unclassified Micromonospora]|uniref:potassium transporter TrkA n=1 Tax=unclassified Micromonospora TaxID=2617518 RepID=UPI001034C09F|nr:MULTISPECIES: potassium transporter TrkA [unclassified Micromonospora]QKW14273.1 potassium transporter TrkA [Verrucosispora sp. NA02020]TBL34531.1 potassium transporter TrkA [Verrucosispora sp. SN26_14.1]
MGKGIYVQELPGIGKRYDVDLGSNTQRISIVVRRDGNRDLYVFAAGADDPVAVIEMSEEQARKVGALLSGTYFSE